MIVGKNWARLVAPNMTDSELWELSQTKMGQKALEMDRMETIKAANGAKSLTLTDSETGAVLTRFTSPEQRSRAYANPLYKTSSAFRDAVMAAEANTAQLDVADVNAGNLRGGFKGIDAKSMLEAAKQDAARGHVAKLFHAANGNTPDAAIARMQIMEMLTSDDPATQEMVAYASSVHHGEESQIVAEMKANKAAGGVTRIQHGGDEGVETKDGVFHAPNSRDIDFSTGLYRDGSTPPSASDDTNS